MSRPETISPKRWNLAQTAPSHHFDELAAFGPVLVQLLFNRNINGEVQANEFLDRRYSRSQDPFLLTDMDKAVARIQQAAKQRELLFVYGDFDADGVTSTVLLTQALRQQGFERHMVQPYIPDRVREGYGLNIDALTTLREKGASLIITVDCGIRSLKEVVHANDIGLDLIICDHHEPGGNLPPAAAIINPKRSDSHYPEKELAGVGVAYKLVQAINSELAGDQIIDEGQFLDLVAIGTVADLVPLLGENRALVAKGLEVLRDNQRPGIDALSRVSGLHPSAISAESVAFALGPRINAAGRIAHAYDAARLLAASNMRMADEYARNLNALNRQRQDITRDLSEKAESMIDASQPLLFAEDPEFHSGVVGLVASRLSNKYYRPTIVVERGETESRGSCRSIPEFNITNALDESAKLLVRHGGHAMAAGFTIKNENLLTFKETIIGIAGSQLDPDALHPSLDIDAELKLSDIDQALYNRLEQLEPTGSKNEPPLFMSRNLQVVGHRPVGRDQSHLQLWVTDGRVKFKGIAFRQGDWANSMPDRVDLAYAINKDNWNGRDALQLMVKDIREATAD